MSRLSRPLTILSRDADQRLQTRKTMLMAKLSEALLLSPATQQAQAGGRNA